MNILAKASRAAFVADTLRSAGFVCQTGASAASWTVSEREFGAPTAHATVRDEWLGLSIGLSCTTGRPPMAAMQFNAMSDRGSRLAIDADTASWVLSDLCLTDADETSAERLKFAATDVFECARRYVSGSGGRPWHLDSAHDAGALAPVVAALAEAGWEAQLDDLGCRVTIHAAGRPYRATLRVDANGGCHVGAEVAVLPDKVDVAHDAAALLMLRTAFCLRMVNPLASMNDGQASFYFAARFDHSRAAADAVHALCALSLALDACGEEVRALSGNSDLARLYLTTQGFKSDAAQPCGADWGHVAANN